MAVPLRRRSRAFVGALVLVALAVLALPAALLLTGGADGGGERATGADGPKQGGRAGADLLSAHPVAGKFEPDGTTLADCRPEKPRCYEQAFGNLMHERGPEAAFRVFDREIARPGPVESDCHRIAHTMGSAALARYDGNVAKAFALGSASCWSGYYHGILERAFTGVASAEELGEVSRSLCDDAGIRRTTFLAYNCVHGLGHGLMIHTGYDLPFSLEVCDRLATDWDQTSCTGGVFMENISSTYGVRSRWLRDDDPVYPCPIVADRHKLYCYLMVTSRVLELNGYDWQATVYTCRRVEPEWIGTCLESLGRDASGNTRQNPEEVARICELAKSWASSCYYGAARDMTSNYANGERAAKLCMLGRGAHLRERCFYGIGTVLGNIAAAPERARAGCAAVTRRYLRSCADGAGA